MKHRRSFGLELPLVMRHVLPIERKSLEQLGHGNWGNMGGGMIQEWWKEVVMNYDLMLTKKERLCL